jgi:hypothetical protein
MTGVKLSDRPDAEDCRLGDCQVQTRSLFRVRRRSGSPRARSRRTRRSSRTTASDRTRLRPSSAAAPPSAPMRAAGLAPPRGARRPRETARAPRNPEAMQDVDRRQATLCARAPAKALTPNRRSAHRPNGPLSRVEERVGGERPEAVERSLRRIKQPVQVLRRRNVDVEVRERSNVRDVCWDPGPPFGAIDPAFRATSGPRRCRPPRS